MSAQLNHTIVWCRDKQVSACYLTDLLGLPDAEPFGPMLVVKFDNGVSLDFYNNDPPIASQHYAFLIGDEDFDAAFARLQARKQPWWADPGKQRPNEINDYGGGRRVYFDDPDGHLLEIFLPGNRQNLRASVARGLAPVGARSGPKSFATAFAAERGQAPSPQKPAPTGISIN